jgi:hypothetical protein
MIDQTIIERAAAYLARAKGDHELALLLACADNTHRAFHRLPPVEATEWTPKPEHRPLDIPSPSEATPL